jgi:hypothetical protein
MEEFLRDYKPVELREMAKGLTKLEIVEVIEFVLKCDEAIENDKEIDYLIMQLKIALKDDVNKQD